MWKRLIRSSALSRFAATRVFAAVSLAAIGGALIAAGNSENLLRSSFEQAIRNSAGVQPAQTLTPGARIPVSGSEEF